MKTVTVNLGDKKYLAAQVTSSEFSTVAEIAAAMTEAGRARDLSKTKGLIRRLAEIVASSIRRAGATITTEEIYDVVPPDDIMTAIKALLDLNAQTDPPAGRGETIH